MSYTVEKLPKFLLNIATLPAKGHRLRLVASGEDKLAIAEFASIVDVAKFEANLEVLNWHRDGVVVKGHALVDYTQTCVVTTDSIERHMDVRFSSKFAPQTSSLFRIETNDEGEMVLDYEGDDPPEPFEGSELDLWLVVLEQFNLELDQFPRKEGAKFEFKVDEGDGNEKQSPFSVLKSLN